MGANVTGYVVAAIRGVPMVLLLQKQNTRRATCPSASAPCQTAQTVPTSPQSSQGAMPMPLPPNSSAATIDASKARSAEKKTHVHVARLQEKTPPRAQEHMLASATRWRFATHDHCWLVSAGRRSAGAHVMWRVRTKRCSCRGIH